MHLKILSLILYTRHNTFHIVFPVRFRMRNMSVPTRAGTMGVSASLDTNPAYLGLRLLLDPSPGGLRC